MRSSIRGVVSVLFLGTCFSGLLEAQALISFTSGTPPNVAVNTGYSSFTFTANDAACVGATYTFSSVDLPAWLQLTAGVLTAVGNGAATAGPYTFHVTASDSCSAQVTNAFTIQVSASAEFYSALTSTQNTIIVTAVNGGTPVTCAASVATDPCFGLSTTTDLTLDNTGTNYVFTPFTGNTEIYSLPVAGGTPTTLVTEANIPNDTVAGPSASSSALFLSAVMDSGGNIIALDTTNHTVWFLRAREAAPASLLLTTS